MLQRDWEEHLFAAEADGLIGAQALLLGLRLSRVITWSERPALHWGGSEMFDALRVSKPTFYRLRKELLATGLITERGGNLVPGSLIHETPSLTDETESLTGGTESLMDETQSLTGETYMHALLDAHAESEPKPTSRSLVITAGTTGREIAATYSQPEQIHLRAAATFVVASLQQWPDAQRPQFGTLGKFFEQAISKHGARAVWEGMQIWLDENEQSTSLRSPAAVFRSQAEEIFEFAAAHPEPTTAPEETQP